MGLLFLVLGAAMIRFFRGRGCRSRQSGTRRNISANPEENMQGDKSSHLLVECCICLCSRHRVLLGLAGGHFLKI